MPEQFLLFYLPIDLFFYAQSFFEVYLFFSNLRNFLLKTPVQYINNRVAMDHTLVLSAEAF